MIIGPIDTDNLLSQMRISLFPILPSFAHMWSILSGALLLASVVMLVIEAAYRITRIYLDRGCGPWLLLGLCNTCYTVFHVPQAVVKAAVAKLREDFDPLALPPRLRRAGDVEAADQRGQLGPYEEPAMELQEMRQAASPVEERPLLEEPRASMPGIALNNSGRYHDAPE